MPPLRSTPYALALLVAASLLCSACAAPTRVAYAQNVSVSPPARIPPQENSDEADEHLLRLAREQGAATEKALQYMLHEQAVAGQETRAGDYLVAYAVEYAEGYYTAHADTLSYRGADASSEVNVHVEVCVRDGADGRFVPGLTVHAALFDARGSASGAARTFSRSRAY